MSSLFATSELFDLIGKVEKGERLDHDAGVRMMNSKDVLALGYMANIVRERKNGNETYYIVDQPYNYSNVHDASMHYGNLEATEELIDQILQLRALQDRTGEFLSFIPLGDGTSTGIQDLKILAISRILLDNFEHIKASWIILGIKLTQVSLAFGVDDLECNVVDEQMKPAMISMIQKAGRDAVELEGLGGST